MTGGVSGSVPNISVRLELILVCLRGAAWACRAA
eukprot:COSAG03_NODE_22401_length_291_cov_1.078125_1_plen_33_part_10